MVLSDMIECRDGDSGHCRSLTSISARLNSTTNRLLLNIANIASYAN